MEFVFGIVLLVSAVFLIVAVLMQSGKSHNLSGTIAGGAETFFGKAKGKTMDKMLGKVTTIVAVFFTLIVVIMYVLQPETGVNTEKWLDDYMNAETTSADTTAVAETAADGETVAETAADTALITEAIDG